MVREFYIENELGQRFSMMDIEKCCFLSSPTGLGYSNDIQFIQIENEFIENIKKIAQGQISGELIFKKYDNFKKLVDFVEGAENLKLVYKLPLENETIEYFKDIDIATIEKGEIGIDGVLRIPITFISKSLWYEAKEVVYNIDSVTNEVRWNFKWNSAFSSYDNRNIVFENKGHTRAPFKLELNGEIMNPIITIFEEEQEVARLDLTGLIVKTGETLIYNTKDTKEQIYKKTETGKENLFTFLNPNFINFYKLRKGVSKIRLEADNEIINGKLTIYVQYKAV